MIRVHVLCEGQTEEMFVNELLLPTFLSLQIELVPTVIGRPGHKGGNVTFEHLFKDIRLRLKQEPQAYCTTLFDFYGMSAGFPGKQMAQKYALIKDKAQIVCSEFTKALTNKLDADAMWRFIPYVQMYEFEALLFSNPAKFAESIYREDCASKFQAIRSKFLSPEEINDSSSTAPSKRIKLIVKEYNKPVYGTLAAIGIGLNNIRQECLLFDAWLTSIEQLSVPDKPSQP